MHEMSICQSLIDQLNKIATEKHAHAIDKIHVQVGPLSGVEPDLLLSVFPFASVDTVAEQAELVLHSMPIRVRCKSCRAESEVQANHLLCAVCGDWQTELISGDELILERVEFFIDH